MFRCIQVDGISKKVKRITDESASLWKNQRLAYKGTQQRICTSSKETPAAALNPPKALILASELIRPPPPSPSERSLRPARPPPRIPGAASALPGGCPARSLRRRCRPPRTHRPAAVPPAPSGQQRGRERKEEKTAPAAPSAKVLGHLGDASLCTACL